MLKKKSNSSRQNTDLWLTSYADLISAIFAVMVLFISFSKIDIEKYDMIQRLLVEKKKKEYKQFSTLEQIKEKVVQVAQENQLEDKVTVKLDKDGLVINFSSAAQFKSGQYELLPSVVTMQPIFNEIIQESQYRYIDIAGYTDDLPGQNMSNWELSAKRALSIQKYLEKRGLNNKNIRLMAYAENMPLVSYENKQNNVLLKAREVNRRVSIIIREARFDDLEKMK